MTGQRPHSSHWGAFHAGRAPGGLDVVADPGDPEPARLLRNVPAMLDERVRVLAPYIRRGWLEHGPGPDSERGSDEYVRASWPEAVRVAAAELDRCRDSFGNASIYGGSYGWASAGRFHHAQSQIHRFLNVLGGYTSSRNTYSLGAAVPLLRYVVGDDEPLKRPTTWPVLAEHTEHFVCFGGMPAKNAQVGAGGVSRHGTADHLRRASARGARFTLIGPQRDDLTAELDAEWLPLIPGTDTALLLALSFVLVERGMHDQEFLRTHCTGFDEFARYLSGAADGVAKSPPWAERICGVDAGTIVRLAESMAGSRTLLNLSWSLQRARHGEQPVWAGIALACLLGQIGLPGGGFGLGYGATASVGHGRLPYGLPTLPQGHNPVSEFIPVARIADMLLHPGEAYDYDGRRLRYPDIRLVYWAGGNPFHHHQDLTRLRQAFGRPETVIVHEQFWTSTARHADIVFPATTTLERDDLGGSPYDSALIAMNRIVPPLGDAKADFEIFRALAAELGVEQAFTAGHGEREWLRELYETWRRSLSADHDPGLDFDRFWAAGRVDLPGRPARHVLYEDCRADPEAHRLPTASGRIELFSRAIDSYGYDDCPGHPAWLVPDELRVPLGTGEFPLMLVANNPATRLHSQLDHGAVSVDAKVDGREPLRMHPRDAAARCIAAGDIVRVTSVRGSLLAAAVLTDAIRPGVVHLSTGAWFDPSAPDAATCVHGNPNALTRDVGASRLSQGCTGQHARVEVATFGETPPPVLAFDPPAIH